MFLEYVTVLVDDIKANMETNSNVRMENIYIWFEVVTA
jgi:hypothetical protein